MIRIKAKTLIIIILALVLSLIPAGSAFAVPESGQAVLERIGGWIDDIWEVKLAEYGAEDLQHLIWKFADEPEKDNTWFIICLAQRYAGELDFSEYRNAYEKYLKDNDIKSATTKLKAAITLQAIGGSNELIDSLTENGIGQLGIMSYIYGLHALRNGAKSSSYTKESVTDILLDMQLPDGGWAVMGENGDVDVTAMTIHALAPECSSNEKVRQAAERGIDLLAARQREDGTFISYGNTNSESTAQVLLALAYMGVDWTQDERFIKNHNGKDLTVEDILYSFSCGKGVFEHVKDGGKNTSAIIQALYCLTGCEMELEGSGHLYVFKDFTEPSVPRPEKSIKPMLYIAIAAAAVIACAILLILRKKSYKSYLFVLIIALIAAAGVRFINIAKPSDYYGGKDAVTDPVKTVISIRCDTVAGEKDYIPKDGIILDNFEVVINKGQTAYDQIISAVREKSIHIDVQGNGYISGIANIYEFDFGDLSGWMYKVNGKFADTGCGEYKLSEGDIVEWLYTRDLGKDIGNEYHGDR